MRGYLAQPKTQVLVRLDRSQVAVHLHEYFLRQVFRKISRTQHAQRQAVDAALVRPDQERERGALAGARSIELLIQ
jgi:hypothetical protein